ncbi:MAG: lysophospholipid acyltransferase family protein [Ignavibacteria bacterium]|nr:lysophospholipid acyltransferase family protein [Ignavibacteria bacterium]
MKLRKFRQDSLRFTAHFFLANVASILCKSIRIAKLNDDHIRRLEQHNKNYILVFWHGTMLLSWYLHGNPNFVALISKSKDGDLLAKILRHWNYKVIRGSSSTGGDVALNIMIDHTKNNYSLAITPDGPRGPVHKLKAGAVVAAKKSEVPLVLVGVGYKKKRTLKSWDHFQVPYFFSEAKVIYSEPVYVDENLTYDETSAMIQECEIKLNELQARAEEF